VTQTLIITGSELMCSGRVGTIDLLCLLLTHINEIVENINEYCYITDRFKGFEDQLYD